MWYSDDMNISNTHCWNCNAYAIMTRRDGEQPTQTLVLATGFDEAVRTVEGDGVKIVSVTPVPIYVAASLSVSQQDPTPMALT